MEGAETRRESRKKEAMSAMSGVATARNKLVGRALTRLAFYEGSTL
jgi:hypothetical protein